MSKSQLRALYKEKRAKLTHEEIEALSLSIANNTLNLPIWGKNYFHLFLSIASKKEVQTEFLLHILQGRDKSIAVPKANFENNEITSILLQDHTQIEISPYGIPEPKEGIEIASNTFEVVFIPLLVFDKIGHRIGYGKGFYDRFLETCNPDCIKVGLSFFEAEKSIKNDPWDGTLNFCVTPQKIYSF